MLLRIKSRFSRRIYTAMAVAGLAAFAGAPAQTLTNPSMQDRYLITGTPDTIPNAWGTTAASGACTTSWDHRTFYLATSPADTASLKVRSSGGCSQSLIQGLNRITAATGHTILIGCYIKTDLTAGRASIAAVRYCGGGGYCQLSWNEFGRVTGTSDWTWAEGSVEIPTAAECAAGCSGGQTQMGMTIHLFMNGIAGSAWWDSLLVQDLTTATTLSVTTPNAPLLRMGRYEATFGTPANYSLTIVAANGRACRAERGVARSVRYFSAPPAPGTYIVRLASDHGEAARTVVIGSR
jgi:hypothetical protein